CNAPRSNVARRTHMLTPSAGPAPATCPAPRPAPEKARMQAAMSVRLPLDLSPGRCGFTLKEVDTVAGRDLNPRCPSLRETIHDERSPLPLQRAVRAIPLPARGTDLQSL